MQGSNEALSWAFATSETDFFECSFILQSLPISHELYAATVFRLRCYGPWRYEFMPPRRTSQVGKCTNLALAYDIHHYFKHIDELTLLLKWSHIIVVLVNWESIRILVTKRFIRRIFWQETRSPVRCSNVCKSSAWFNISHLQFFRARFQNDANINSHIGISTVLVLEFTSIYYICKSLFSPGMFAHGYDIWDLSWTFWHSWLLHYQLQFRCIPRMNRSHVSSDVVVNQHMLKKLPLAHIFVSNILNCFTLV